METIRLENRVLTQFEAAQDLEFYLGDPLNENTPFSYKKSVALDENEDYPEAFIGLINRWGLQHYYIPKHLGGKFGNLEEMFAITRVLSRRDLTTTIAHGGTFLGSIATWIGAHEERQLEVAKLIKNHKKIALSLTEFQHGSDLSNNEVSAAKLSTGNYIINGEKWLFNHATKSDAITMLVKTKAENTPRSHSLIFLEKSQLNPSSFKNLEKIKTHGVRGLDMGGITLNNLEVSSHKLIGKEGVGLELIIKSLQITRMICGAFSLGALDTCLRTVLKFGLERKLYGNYIIKIPVFRKNIIACFTKLIAAECISMVATRGLSIVPEQFSMLSAVVKSIVPNYAEQSIDQLSSLFGARYYLREEYDFGIFQKFLRDNATVSLFDGNTAVNQHAILLQLPFIVKSRAKEWTKRAPEIQTNTSLIYRLNQAIPEVNLSKLRVIAKGKDDLGFGLTLGLQQLAELIHSESNEKELLTEIYTIASAIGEFQNTLNMEIATSSIQLGNLFNIPARYYDYAKQYGIIHMASACLNLWLHNKKQLDMQLQKPIWLLACLTLLNNELGLKKQSLSEFYEKELLTTLINLFDHKKMFSLFPIQLA